MVAKQICWGMPSVASRVDSDLPAIDDRLVVSNTRYEMYDGELVYVSPADPPPRRAPPAARRADRGPHRVRGRSRPMTSSQASPALRRGQVWSSSVRN